MRRYLPIALLMMAVGFAAGFVTSGYRLSGLQAKAAAEKAKYENALLDTEKQLSQVNDILEHSTRAHKKISMRNADYEALQAAYEIGAINLELAPELSAILMREMPAEIAIKYDAQKTCPEYAMALEKLEEKCQ